MGIWSLIVSIVSAIVAYIKYRYDPEMIKRRDEINKKAAEGKALDEINVMFADKNVLSLAFFISEFLRRKGPTDPTAGWITDLLDRKLPKPRDPETKAKDAEEGVDLG